MAVQQWRMYNNLMGLAQAEQQQQNWNQQFQTGQAWKRAAWGREEQRFGIGQQRWERQQERADLALGIQAQYTPGARRQEMAQALTGYGIEGQAQVPFMFPQAVRAMGMDRRKPQTVKDLMETDIITDTITKAQNTIDNPDASDEQKRAAEITIQRNLRQLTAKGETFLPAGPSPENIEARRSGWLGALLQRGLPWNLLEGGRRIDISTGWKKEPLNQAISILERDFAPYVAELERAGKDVRPEEIFRGEKLINFRRIKNKLEGLKEILSAPSGFGLGPEAYQKTGVRPGEAYWGAAGPTLRGLAEQGEGALPMLERPERGLRAVGGIMGRLLGRGMF